MQKSHVTVFLLTLFFGPLGLFYVSTAAAFGCLAIAIVFGSLTMGLAAIIMWPVSIILGHVCVSRHNAIVEKEEIRHRELVGVENKFNAR